MYVVLFSLIIAYIIGCVLNLTLFVGLIIEELVLYSLGAYAMEQRLGYKEIFKRIIRTLGIIVSSWGFWLTTRHTLNDFYIMGRR